MKLQINYDLLDKIQEAKTGIRFKKIPVHMLTSMATFVPLTIGFDLVSNTPEETVPDLILGTGMLATLNFAREAALSSITKEKSQEDLNLLCSYLERLNISTTQNNLLESKKYKTEYKLTEKSEKGLRKLQTNKYILIPTPAQKEVSILQEHIPGSNEYFLSIGEPKKVYKLSLAKNPV